MYVLQAFKIKEEETLRNTVSPRGDAFKSKAKKSPSNFVVNICGCAQDWTSDGIYRCFNSRFGKRKIELIVGDGFLSLEG